MRMNKSTIRRLSVIAVIATSLLAVGVVAAISTFEEAEALRFAKNLSKNGISVSQINSVKQTNIGSGG
jgi:hypothetical protein